MIINKAKKLNYEKIVPTVFFTLFFLVGIFIFADYGVSTDEWQQRQIGITSLNYVANVFNISHLFNGLPTVTNPSQIFDAFVDKDYGVAFELPAELLITLLNIQGPNVYHFRHLLTFFVFFCGVLALYQISKTRFGSWKWGLLASLFLILSPRIFGDSFYNDKDIVFLSAYLCATFTLIKLLNKPSLINAFWHALATAIAIDVRITGIILPAATIAILLLMIPRKEIDFSVLVKAIISYITLTCAMVVLFWPWLWLDPLNNFAQAYKNMANFRWGGSPGGDGLFFGSFINSRNLPWYFIPGWMMVTTPILYLFLAPIGILKTLSNLWSAKLRLWRSKNELQDLIFLGLFMAPLAAVIVLNSTLYNGWRQMFFIYPPFILLAMVGLNYLWTLINKKILLKNLLSLLVIASCVWIALWIYRWHPYEYLYFNVIAKDWSKRFDLDYWGTAFRKPLEKIVNRDERASYVIHDGRGMDWGIWVLGPYRAKLALPPEKMSRVDNHQSEACSDYIFTSILGPWKQYSEKKEFELFDELSVDGKMIYQTWSRKAPLQRRYDPSTLKEIDFSDPNSRCFLKDGWLNTETWGVWSTGKSSELALPIPNPIPKFVTIQMKAFSNTGTSNQKAILIAGGRSYEINFMGDKPTVFKLPLDQTTIKDHMLSISIQTPNAVTPKSIGLGNDDRVLGLGLIKVKFE